MRAAERPVPDRAGETVDDLILERQRDDCEREDPDRPERLSGNRRIGCKETDEQAADGACEDKQQRWCTPLPG